MNLLTKLLSTTALLVLVTAVAVAEEAGGGGGGSTSMIGRVIDAGPVEWVLILLSFVGFALGIQRFMTIKPDVLVPEGLVDDLHAVFEEGATEDAVEEALGMIENDESLLGQITFAAIDKQEYGFEAMREAAENVASAEHNKLMAQINVLSLLASIGPMLGLLGTVWGMISAFFTMASAGGQVDPAILSSSIGGAMITTATGLIIAIPMLVIFFFLRGKVNKAVLDASLMTSEVLDYFRGR